MGCITHSGSSGLFIEEYAPARRLASESYGSRSHQEDQTEDALEARKMSTSEDGAGTEEEQWLAPTAKGDRGSKARPGISGNHRQIDSATKAGSKRATYGKPTRQ